MGEDECWARLGAVRRAVLGTVHPRRGVDLVPVVLAVDRPRVVVPVDAVKPKSGARLQRLVNLGRDPRCVVLADRYDDDWSQLWWVRASGRAVEAPPTDDVLARLAERYPPYRDAGTVTATIVVTVDEITGWSATA